MLLVDPSPTVALHPGHERVSRALYCRQLGCYKNENTW